LRIATSVRSSKQIFPRIFGKVPSNHAFLELEEQMM